MFRHEEKLTLVPVKTFLKNSANIITAFKTGFTVIPFHVFQFSDSSRYMWLSKDSNLCYARVTISWLIPCMIGSQVVKVTVFAAKN